MNREEYLKELSKYLKKLPKKDYEDTMNYFEEYFDEVSVEKEQDLIRELGSPSVAASEILSKMLNENISKNESKKKIFKESKMSRTFLIGALCLLAAPIGVPLTLAGIVLIFTLFMVCVTILFATFMLVFAGALVTIKLFVIGVITTFSSSISGGLIFLGSALIVLAITGLLYILGNGSIKFFINLSKKLISFVSRKRGKCDE